MVLPRMPTLLWLVVVDASVEMIETSSRDARHFQNSMRVKATNMKICLVPFLLLCTAFTSRADLVTGWVITNGNAEFFDESELSNSPVTTGADGDTIAASITPITLNDGDFNEDDVVDAADYTVWRDNLGAPTGTLPNDPTGLLVGRAQYTLLKSQFGMTTNSVSPVASKSVPEPATALLILLAVGVLTIDRSLRLRRAYRVPAR